MQKQVQHEIWEKLKQYKTKRKTKWDKPRQCNIIQYDVKQYKTTIRQHTTRKTRQHEARQNKQIQSYTRHDKTNYSNVRQHKEIEGKKR